MNNRVNGRLAVSRAIGDFEFKSLVGSADAIVSCVPEIRMVELAEGDEFIVIACDGLFDVMSTVEVGGFVKARIGNYVKRSEEPDPNQIAVDLVTESIMKRNTSDNVTVIVVLLKKFR